MEKLKKRALALGATDLKRSTRKNKKWMVKYNGKWVHFGAYGMSDYTIHNDKARRDSYRARHSKILLKDGTQAYKVKTQPSFWSWHLL